jgi:hypothetical protein
VSVTTNLTGTFGTSIPALQAAAAAGGGGPPVAFLPAPGDHLLSYKGRWMLISRQRTSGNPQLAANARWGAGSVAAQEAGGGVCGDSMHVRNMCAVSLASRVADWRACNTPCAGWSRGGYSFASDRCLHVAHDTSGGLTPEPPAQLLTTPHTPTAMPRSSQAAA